MTGDQDPNNPDEYLRKLQDAAQTPETTTPTNYGQQPGNQPPQYQQTGYQQPGYPQPGYPQPPIPSNYANTLPAHPSATVALVLGIVGLASIPLACGLGLVVSPFAWRMGAQAVNEIDANPGRYSGRENANAGRITGIIGTIMLVVFVLLGLAAVMLFAFTALTAVETGTTYRRM